MHWCSRDAAHLRDVLMSLDKGKNILGGLQVCVLRETVFAVYNYVQLCSLCATLRICAILHHLGPILGPIFVVLFSSKTFLFLDLIFLVSRTHYKVLKCFM